MKFSLHPYRGFILGAVVSALAVSGAWATWGMFRSEEAGPKVVSGNGRLDVQRIEIATKFPGQVQTIAVREGDVVKVGDVVAQMDATDLQRQLDGVMAMRQRATQAMARAQGEISVQSLKAKVAQMDYDNALRMRNEVLISESELKKREAQRDGESSGVRIATAALGEAKAAQAEADAGIERLKNAIVDHTLKAPVNGSIEYRVVEPGSVIPAGGRVATLVDPTQVHMTIFLPTKVAGQVRVGDDARIVLDAAPDVRLPAKVSFVSADAQFTPKHVETASEREKLSFRVKLSLTPEVALANAGLLKGGLTGNGFVRLADAPAAQDSKKSDERTAGVW
ncbi:MAG: HlyD family efflux transporter periplasmic adaptor subunit [Aquabacterium sp.]|uniref:HlyD family secretion protein n=1 Tax=Aquabacterium sp. TaxID=1872578 RepID=UPI001B731253|nr:HlyD family efflux transporter periplasmic adaptor subunit [Aquabacterium sp.]MBP7131648.1 HlyD family efflux transporter periplasmic adaptor subunit [Aquabacterium sp.]MBP9062243.1 HlyD family efflux transporter periplasmic adaptor subunit [Aquabacterium sp.]